MYVHTRTQDKKKPCQHQMVLGVRDVKVEQVARKRRHPWFRQEHLEYDMPHCYHYTIITHTLKGANSATHGFGRSTQGRNEATTFIALLQGGVRTGSACGSGVGKAARTDLAIR
jgi:hypothetical protein